MVIISNSFGKDTQLPNEKKYSLKFYMAKKTTESGTQGSKKKDFKRHID